MKTTFIRCNVGACYRWLARWALCGLAALTGAAYASPGDVDTSFGASGRVIVASGFLNPAQVAADAVLQPDGKIIVAGTCRTIFEDPMFCVTRHTAAGPLDTTFGLNNTGVTYAIISSSDSYAAAVALQRDRKIVVAGYCGNSASLGPLDSYDICLIRLLPDGNLDDSFGLGGMVRVRTLGRDELVYDVAIDGNGKIVVAGSATTTSALDVTAGFAARFFADGVLDGSYGVFGVALVGDATAGSEGINSLALVPFAGSAGDDFMFGGSTRLPSGANFYAGALGGSNAPTAFNIASNYDFGAERVRLANGGSVLIGACNSGTSFCAARLDVNGNLDATFGTGGKVSIPSFASGGSASRTGVAQPDGKLVLAGDCYIGGVGKLCLARLNVDGSLDRTFGVGGTGYVVSTVGTDDSGVKLLLQPDGKLLLAGTCRNASGIDSFCISRYEGGPNTGRFCSLDVDGDGQVLATTDMLIVSRITAGMTGNQVLNGINLAGKPRGTWKDIREYLIGQCGMSIAQ